MIREISKNRSGEQVSVEHDGSHLVMRLGRSPDLQSCLPVPPSMYWNAVKLTPEPRNSICVVGVGGGSAGHVAKGAGFKWIVGIEADKEMLALGERHFNVRDVFNAVALGDCYDFEEWRKLGWDEKYDCIFFDAYNGSALSIRALESVYLRFLLSKLTETGVLLFNCPTRATMDALRDALTVIGRSGSWHKYASNWVCEIRKVKL